MSYGKERGMESRIRPSNANAIDRFLKIFTIIATVMSLFGFTLIGVFSFVLKTFRDPWQAATLAAIALLIPCVSLIIKGSVYRQIVKPGLTDEVSGWHELVDRAQQYIQEASASVSYIAGDFSSVSAIDKEIADARNRTARSASTMRVSTKCESRLLTLAR
jgi:hypothetical protein